MTCQKSHRIRGIHIHAGESLALEQVENFINNLGNNVVINQRRQERHGNKVYRIAR